MFAHAAVPLIDDLLGQTTLYEEQRGDFIRAAKEAERHLAAARNQSDPHRLADALLARGILYLLQGEAVAARTSFEESDRQAADDPARQLRARAYNYQAILLNFNYFPNGGVATAQEVNADGALTAYVASSSKNIEEVRSLVHEPALLLEYRLLGQRQLVMLARQAKTPAFDLSIRQLLANNFQQFRESVEAEGAPPRVVAALDVQFADLLFAAGQGQPALETLQRASASYERLGDPVGMANCLMKLGDFAVAPFGPPEVWNTGIAEGSPSNALRWEIEATEFDPSGLNVEGARASYERARKLYHEAEAARGLAAIELRCGYLATLGCDGSSDAGACYGRAARHAAAARERYLNAGDWLGFQVARAHEALCRVGMGQHPEDQATAEDIGAWGRISGSFSFSVGLGLLFARLGRRWLVREGDYERALECFRLSESLFRGLGGRLSQARSLTDQSIVYEMLGERNAFVVTSERAWQLCEAVIRDQPAVAGSAWQQASWIAGDLMEMANTRADADGIARVADRMQKLVPLLPGIEDGALAGGHADLDWLLAPIAEAMAGEADTERARLVAIARMVVQRIEQAKFMEPLYRGRQARNDGDEAQAQIWFERALETIRGRNSSSRERMQMEAIVLGYQRRNAEAAWAYQQYMEQERIAIGRRELPNELGKDQLRNFHKQALLFFSRIKSYGKAQLHLEELAKLDGPNWWTLDGAAWDNLSLAGEVYEGLGRWKEALASYVQAMETFEQRRHQLTSDELKTALASDSKAQYMYFQAARTALKVREAALEGGDAAGGRANLARAFEAIERGKARSLLDLMAGGAMLGGGAGENPRLRRWRGLSACLSTRRGLLAHEHNQQHPDQQRIDALSREIAVTEEELRRLEAGLSSTDPRAYRAQTGGSDVITLDAVGAALPADTSLLQYAFLGEDLIAWAITCKGSEQVHRANLPENALKRQIRTFHRLCEAGMAVEDLGEELGDTLLAPFEQTIAAYQRLVIVPYGAAHLLPFHALPWRGKPLGATRIVTYLPSASFIQFMRFDAAPSLPRRVLAVGNPADMQYQEPGTDTPRRLGELPAAETEAVYIASLFPGSRALIREQATAASVRAHLDAYPILHFATHGHLSEEVPLLSAIMLAGGDALTVYEMMGLRLEADLVVMSACRTGQGETTAGDDVLGLARALLAAGARAALVSLWPVNDAATSILMGEFYRRLRSGEKPAAALQAAQEYLRTRTYNELGSELEDLKGSLEQGNPNRSTIEPIDRSLWGIRDIESVDGKLVVEARDYSHPFFWAPFLLIGV